MHYTQNPREDAGDSERKPIMRPIRTIKEAVTTEQVAAEYTDLKRQGQNLVGLCPNPDHEEKTPSFTVYPDGHFHCFGCHIHGDVIDLEEIAGEHADAWTAMVALSERYNVKLPSRSQKWHHWQREKLAIENLAENLRFEVECRRAFKLLMLNAPEIQAIEDPAERREEIRRCWDAFQDGMGSINKKMRRLGA